MNKWKEENTSFDDIFLTRKVAGLDFVMRKKKSTEKKVASTLLSRWRRQKTNFLYFPCHWAAKTKLVVSPISSDNSWHYGKNQISSAECCCLLVLLSFSFCDVKIEPFTIKIPPFLFQDGTPAGSKRREREHMRKSLANNKKQAIHDIFIEYFYKSNYNLDPTNPTWGYDEEKVPHSMHIAGGFEKKWGDME